jgi:hypothetical protein
VSKKSLSLFDESPRERADSQRRHLAAARRLSKRIARLPDRSEEQTRAGRQICRHLVAMLKDIEAQQQPPHPH